MEPGEGDHYGIHNTESRKCVVLHGSKVKTDSEGKTKIPYNLKGTPYAPGSK